MHFNMLQFNDISHQQHLRERRIQKAGESTVIKVLSLPNYLVKSNRLIASLPLLLLSKLLLPLFYSYLLINRALFTNFFNCTYFSTCPRWPFYLLGNQQGALLIRDSEPCNNDNPNKESTQVD